MNVCVITSELNTTEKDVYMPEPVVVETEMDTRDQLITDSKSAAERDQSKYEP